MKDYQKALDNALLAIQSEYQPLGHKGDIYWLALNAMENLIYAFEDKMALADNGIMLFPQIPDFYIRKGIEISSLIHGGAQERGKRAGTTNAAGIIGTAKAVEIAATRMEKRTIYERKLRDYLIERVLKEIPYTVLNGDREMRLSNNANFCFRFIEGESLMILLDLSGIAASSGSACTSGALDPSHVLLAIGRPKDIARGSIRLTLSDETTKDDIDKTVDVLKKSVERLRGMSPFYEAFINKQK